MDHIPIEAKQALLNGGLVCRHSDGGKSVPADQFGEQTYIKTGKGCGGLKKISTNSEQVAVWVNSFSVCAHLDYLVDDMYKDTENQNKKQNIEKHHKEESTERRKLDDEDRQKIQTALQNLTHPLTSQDEKLFNISNGQVASETVNVQDALSIGFTQSDEFFLSQI